MATKIQLTRQYCPNCNADVTAAEFPYCPACDTEFDYCPVCQKPLDIDAVACHFCGADLAAGDP
jgi:hypothetical protein